MSNYTTVEYRSNLEPLEDGGKLGEGYLSKIHDPFALEALKKYLNSYRSGYNLTDIQQREMRAASGHCAYAFKDDYPWGTITLNGRKTVVCKCTNRSCNLFSECRSGISAWKEGEDQLDLPKEHKKDFSLEREEGRRFIRELTGMKSAPVQTAGTRDNKSPAVQKKNTEVEPVGGQLGNAQGWSNSAGISIGTSASPLPGMPIASEEEEKISFDEWLEQQGQNPNFVKFYTGSLKSIDLLAHNHGLWEGKLAEKGREEAEELADAFRKLQVSGRESIMMRQLLQVIDLFGQYLEDTKSNTKTVFPEPPEVEPPVTTQMDGAGLGDSPTGNKFEKEGTGNGPLTTDGVNKHNPDKGEGEGDNQAVLQGETAGTESAGETTTPIHLSDTPLSFESFKEMKQEDIIEALVTDKIIVNAGPGTGKTYTLIARIINLINTQHVDPDQILVLCFSRAAVEVIEKRLEEAYRDGRIGINWHSVEIRTFDSFATFNLAWAMKEAKETLPDGFSLQGMDYDSRILEATGQLKNHPDVIAECRHFIVDEVQDLVSARADFVEQIIKSLPDDCGYTLLGDACQSIYNYQRQTGQTGSADFYRWLFNTQKEARRLSLGVNYRQTSDLENIGQNLRETILSGDVAKMKEGLEKIEENISRPEELNLKQPDIDVLNDIAQDGSLGILTRTNGQSLLISTWMRAADIPHTVQKRLSDHEYDRWIADVFCGYPNDTITYDEFECYAGKAAEIASESCKSLWEALVSTQYDRDRERFNVSDLLQGIIENGKARELYTSDINDRITVSNIHRSKGREYDRVIVLDDILGDTDQEKNAEEYRVSYVAVTRARKELFRTSLGKQYIYLDKNGDRRAYECGLNRRNGNKRLTHIEVGRPRDLNMFSMAGEKPQKIIHRLIPGTSVTLKKDKIRSEVNGYITYVIKLDGEDGVETLGETGIEFFRALERILHRVKDLPDYCKVRDYVYPDDITDIYVDDVISAISTYKSGTDGAKRYGNMMVWRAVSLTGFGRLGFENY